MIQPVELPITKSAVMNAKLAEWISAAVEMMNADNAPKIIHRWETGLLDA